MQTFNTERCTNMHILLQHSALLLQAKVHFSMRLNKHKGANDNTDLNIIKSQSLETTELCQILKSHLPHTPGLQISRVAHLKGDSKKKRLVQ